MHKCDNHICCNIEHLFVGNHTDNMRDARNKGKAGSQVIDIVTARKIIALKLAGDDSHVVFKKLKSGDPDLTLNRVRSVFYGQTWSDLWEGGYQKKEIKKNTPETARQVIELFLQGMHPKKIFEKLNPIYPKLHLTTIYDMCGKRTWRSVWEEIEAGSSTYKLPYNISTNAPII